MAGKFGKCPICGKWPFVKTHKCQPRWEVNIPDYYSEDEWISIYAVDEEEAAKEIAEEYDNNGDYPLANEEEAIILVRKSKGSPVKKFRCFAERTIQYYANEIEE